MGFYKTFSRRLFHSDNERTDLVKKNIWGTVLIKGLSVPVSLLIVPVTINYINSEMYGIWLTLTSIVGWIGFFDIGFGNGLRNKLAETIALGDYHKGKCYISTTYACLILIFFVVGLISYIVIPFINWSNILNTSYDYEQQIIAVMRIVVVFFCIQMVLKVQTNVWMALQMNAVASLSDALGQVITLIGIWILTKIAFPSLTLLALVYNGAPVIVFLIMTFLLFERRKDLRPFLQGIKREYAGQILNLGGKFFIIQMSVLLTYSTTNFIMSNVAGPESVTEFNVVYKYLNIANMIMSMIIAPIWSAYTDAYTRNDLNWMQTTYKRLLFIFCAILGLLLFMTMVYVPVFKIWLGDSVEVHISMVVIVFFYILSLIWVNLNSAILNGIGKISFILIWCNVQTLFTIPVSYVLGKSIGAEGVILGILLVSLPSWFFLPYQVVHIMRGDAKGIMNR